jgi:pyruvate/2-oxoglutarate dehydrogenase complex dihydrolipoamide dehydrogenase (E3) component
MDYDLIVVGVSDASYRLVVQASQLGARVGWIIEQKYDQYQLRYRLDYSWDLLTFLAIINTTLHSKLIDLSALHLKQNDVTVLDAKQYIAKQDFAYSLAMTNIKGVDIIEGQKMPKAYIYAIVAPVAKFPHQVLGLAEHPYVTVADVCDWVLEGQDSPSSLPNSIAILGNDSLTCTIAQITNSLGIHTILLVDHQHILPHVDVEVARTLQAQLEMEGIAVYTQAQVTAVELIEGRSRLWLNRPSTIDCDRLCIPYPQRNYPIPNAQSAFPCHSDRDIAKIINQIPNLTQSMVMPSHPIVTVTPTEPPIAQVGMTAAIAQQKNKIKVLETVTTDGGLCKITCDTQGKILGASMYGDRAEFVIRSLAIAMQGKVRLQELNLPCIFHS